MLLIKFWKPTEPLGFFSQWYMSNFEFKGQQFCCAEQAMMWSKAILFNDNESAAKILNTDNPSTMRSLGRSVKNFDQTIWDQEKLGIAIAINYCKFTQDEELYAVVTRQTLCSFFDKGGLLVEASPYDRIWGIGLSADDPLSNDPKSWKGQNLLGKALYYAIKRIMREM